MSHSENIPDYLAPRVDEALARLSPALEFSDEVKRQARRVFAASPFVRQWCLRHPDEVLAMLAGEPCEPPQTDDQRIFDAALRHYRNRAMVRIAWQEISATASPQATVEALSDLADDCLQRALDWHLRAMRRRHGVARLTGGKESQFVIIALGKLGGRELNFSSDVDVIFAYSGSGESDGDKPLSNEQYFVRLGQRIVGSMQDISEHGFVFRVDLRLRPFGEKSPVSHSMASLEAYYEAHGREWERYAWIKARVSAGSKACGRELIRSLQPFIYRRYLDYGAIESLREMKAQIDEQVRKRGHSQDIKLGWGGIREVEFVIQVFQLVRGGAEPSLRSNRLMEAMDAVVELELHPQTRIDTLRQAYWFLRRVENCWQAQQDHQSHVLPDDEEPRLALACALGFPGWDALDTELQRYRASVHAEFSELFAQPDEGGIDPGWMAWWCGGEALPPAVSDAKEQILQLRQRVAKRLARKDDRHEIGELVALLLAQIDDDEAAARVFRVIDVLVGRGTYIKLLRDSAVARRELIQLCGKSAWLSEQIRQYPMVLAELLDPAHLYVPDGREVLRGKLRGHLDSLPVEDMEARMDVLRRARHTAMLRIAAADVSAALPIMRVSDRLSELAEEVLAAALDEAVAQMRQRYVDLPEPEFAVIAYGKLGGLELGYSSDLDLVFVFDAQQDGLPRDPAVFYTRLAQKLIHFLATPTGAGVAYEIDTRLRPSGTSGLLVTSIQGLHRYQMEQAWTWEHQALIRARPVAGSARLAEEFNATRAAVLQKHRDPLALLGDVREMREKMRQELAPKDGTFSPKHSVGGIVDIEFLTQFAVLALARQYPEIGRYTDVIRICEQLRIAGLVQPEAAEHIAEAYRQLRMLNHQRFLAGTDPHRRPEGLDVEKLATLLADLQDELAIRAQGGQV